MMVGPFGVDENLEVIIPVDDLIMHNAEGAFAMSQTSCP